MNAILIFLTIALAVASIAAGYYHRKYIHAVENVNFVAREAVEQTAELRDSLEVSRKELVRHTMTLATLSQQKAVVEHPCEEVVSVVIDGVAIRHFPVSALSPSIATSRACDLKNHLNAAL